MPSTLTNLVYHIVFSTGERRRLITDDVREDLHAYMGGTIRGEGGKLIAVGGTRDHVHLVCRIPPSVSVSDVLRQVKANSSRWMGERGTFAWQRGYAAFTVSESMVADVTRYVRNQQQHHATRGFQDELLGLLRRHNVAFDERFLWD